MADWFAPKRYGYGGGLPISWQGWAVTLVFAAVAIGASLLASRSMLAAISILLTATVIFIIIVAKTTRGGWRWRWGDKE